MYCSKVCQVVKGYIRTGVSKLTQPADLPHEAPRKMCDVNWGGLSHRSKSPVVLSARSSLHLSPHFTEVCAW